MKIEKLKLRGFIGIKKNMGLDKLSLDFSEMSGLIALAGVNGFGKSTVLDNLHPFAMLPSRSGAIQHHTFLRDSEKEFCFRTNGDRYRTLLKVDSQSEKVEGFIYKNDESGSLTNGKISEYKAYVSRLFGTSNLFFNSVFCAQNSDKISDMTTGDLKKLFSEFLQLHRLVDWENTSKQCANIRGGQIEKIHQDIEDISFKIARRGDLDEMVRVAKQDLQTAEHKHGELVSTLDDVNLDLEAERDKIANNELARARIGDIEKELAGIKDEVADDVETEDKNLEDMRDDVSVIKSGIMECGELLLNETAIRAAAEKEKVLAGEVETLGADIVKLWDQYQAAKEALDGKEKRRADLIHDLDKLNSDPELRGLKQNAETCRKLMAVFESIDPNCDSKVCGLITHALDAKKSLPDIEKRITDMVEISEKVKAHCTSTIEAVDAEIQKTRPYAAERKEAYDTCKQVLQTRQGYLKTAKELAADLPRVEVAAARKIDLEKQHGELVEKGKEKKAAMVRDAEMNANRVDNIERKVAEIRSTIDAEAEKKIIALNFKIESLKEGIKGLDFEEMRLKGEIIQHEKDLEQKQVDIKKLADLDAEQKRLSAERSRWAYLKDACSKDGLRALEIDAVTPKINEYANELLRLGQFPDMVKLITQDPEGKEILDLLCIDRDGDETLLSNRSGGEKVWPLKTIRLAMARINNEKSGRDFRTLLADEEDGPLSLENALRFVSLYRSIITPHPETGARTFDDCVYISHKSECVAMADHVLRFGKGGVEVE